MPHHTTYFLWFYDQFQWRHLNMADQTKAKELKSRWQMLSPIPIPQWIKFSFFGRSGCPRPKFNVKEYNAQWVKNIFDGNFISCFHEIFMKSRWQMLSLITLPVQIFRWQKNQPLLIHPSRHLRDSQKPKTKIFFQFS